MTKGVLLFRPSSKYVDEPERQYQFPKRYKTTLEKFVGDWIVYNELLAGKGSSGYQAAAIVGAIVPDPNISEMYIAQIEPESYFEFEQFVPYRAGEAFMETRLHTGTKKPSGYAQSAVREISDEDFYRIIYRGNPLNDFDLPRSEDDQSAPSLWEVREPDEPFEYEINRERFSTIISKPIRKQIFRKNVIAAYDKRCALTGLSLINGGGRPEVEAAHIRPVEAGGPDRLTNGLALSGTIHWMFDRGLVSLSDDYKVLISRQVNDPDQIRKLILPSQTALVPHDPKARPHPRYLDWHRTDRFKN